MSDSSAAVNTIFREKKEIVHTEHICIILGLSSNPISHISATAIEITLSIKDATDMIKYVRSGSNTFVSTQDLIGAQIYSVATEVY